MWPEPRATRAIHTRRPSLPDPWAYLELPVHDDWIPFEPFGLRQDLSSLLAFRTGASCCLRSVAAAF